MTTLNTELNKSQITERELTIGELDAAAGGCPGWLGPVAGAIALGASIRIGFESLIRRLF